jgi:hypothetical protein
VILASRSPSNPGRLKDTNECNHSFKELDTGRIIDHAAVNVTHDDGSPNIDPH